MAMIIYNTSFAEVLIKHRTGNCGRCGKEVFLFDHEVWLYCE
ncbi:ribosomal protein S27AE [Metabacillus crassostreae]|nr:ribosomal protein S27AE [Metabacillus crassostreae]